MVTTTRGGPRRVIKDDSSSEDDERDGREEVSSDEMEVMPRKKSVKKPSAPVIRRAKVKTLAKKGPRDSSEDEVGWQEEGNLLDGIDVPKGSVQTATKATQRPSDIDSEMDQNLAELTLEAKVRTVSTQQAALHDRADEDEEAHEMPMAASKTEGIVMPLPATIVNAPVPQGPVPRLIIDKMVLINFKSYAGRQIIGPFHKSFSSVVGPNGSGKSNVIDALLFVFGYRASKMRQGKLSELIHNSDGASSLDSCSVEVHFRQILDGARPDESTDVPNSELVVSRQAQRNNSSKYFINDRTSNYTEVTSLLKDRGIDLEHKRFLILQGEVESISQMPPKARNEHEDGLLEYLEDIIGTSVYKSAIEEASVQVDTLNEDRSVKLARVRVTEKEMSSLEDRRQEALTFLKEQNDLTTARSKLWQIYIMECAKNLEILASNVEHYKGELERELSEHKGLQDEVTAREKLYDEQAAICKEEKAKHAAWTKQRSGQDRDEINLQERRKHLQSKIKKLAKTEEATSHSLSEARSWIENHGDAVKSLTGNQAKLEKQLVAEEAILDEICDSLKGKTEVHSQAIAKHEADLAPWLQKISEAKASQDISDAEAGHIRERIESAKESLLQCEQIRSELKDRLAAKQEEAKEAKASRDDIHERLKVLQDELVQNESLLAQSQLERGTISAKLEESKASQSASSSKSQILASLTALKNAGKLNGFHGRLGDLGTIAEQYDIAISTACPALDNLVVDNVDVGQKCIAHIRAQGLGRAVFILLDQLVERDYGQMSTPDQTPRLFDLVKIKDDVYRPAFFSVLQNTLVASDLEEANRIAYQGTRWRVVTLQGQLIDKSGTMAGGGTRVARGAMTSARKDAIPAQDLAKIAQDLSSLDAQIVHLKKAIREQNTQLEAHQNDLSALDVAVAKIDMERSAVSKQVKDIEGQVNEARANSVENPADTKRLAELIKSSQSAAKTQDSLRTQCAHIENSIKQLQEKILEIGGMKLRTQKAKVDSLKEQIEHVVQQISVAETSGSKSAKDAERFAKVLTEHRTEISKIEEQLKSLDAESATQRAAMEASVKDNKDAQKSIDTKEKKLKELKQGLEAKKSELFKVRAGEIDIRNKLEDSEKALKDSHAKSKHWNDKHRTLTMADLDTENGEEASEIQEYTEDELYSFSRDQLKTEIAILEERTQNASPNLGVLAEYKKREAEFTTRAEELDSITRHRDAAKDRAETLRKRRLEEFMAGFGSISLKLKEMYQMITMGGNAELELVDSLDPFAEGIIFSVMPPKKSWKNISNLSGGEKTLSSLALVFALHHFKPTPIYVMDEIDAALDFRNVSVVANYIKERNRNGQFIIISLRNNMFELASRLVGIYKTQNQTKSVTLE